MQVLGYQTTVILDHYHGQLLWLLDGFDIYRGALTEIKSSTWDFKFSVTSQSYNCLYGVTKIYFISCILLRLNNRKNLTIYMMELLTWNLQYDLVSVCIGQKLISGVFLTHSLPYFLYYFNFKSLATHVNPSFLSTSHLPHLSLQPPTLSPLPSM